MAGISRATRSTTFAFSTRTLSRQTRGQIGCARCTTRSLRSSSVLFACKTDGLFLFAADCAGTKSHSHRAFCSPVVWTLGRTPVGFPMRYRQMPRNGPFHGIPCGLWRIPAGYHGVPAMPRATRELVRTRGNIKPG